MNLFQLAAGTLKRKKDKGFLAKLTHAVTTNAFILDNVILKMAKDKVSNKDSYLGKSCFSKLWFEHRAVF